jgi:hypothetical protein
VHTKHVTISAEDIEKAFRFIKDYGQNSPELFSTAMYSQFTKRYFEGKYHQSELVKDKEIEFTEAPEYKELFE